jgi:hypothetical protein
MDTVESALNRHVNVLLVDLAIGSGVLGVAHTSSIVAPSSVAAIIRASSQTAINTSEAGLAPAGSVEAKTVVGAIVDTNGELAIDSMPLGTTNTGAVVALSVRKNASITAKLHRAIKVGPRGDTLTTTILAVSMTRALIGA